MPGSNKTTVLQRKKIYVISQWGRAQQVKFAAKSKSKSYNFSRAKDQNVTNNILVVMEDDNINNVEHLTILEKAKGKLHTEEHKTEVN